MAGVWRRGAAPVVLCAKGMSVWDKQTELVNIGPPRNQEHYQAYLQYKEARRQQ
jgi:hypothetical protein